jgi:acyl carrier protein
MITATIFNKNPMNNLEIYDKIFINSFNVNSYQLDTLTYRSISGWDSIGHLILISALEEAFEISLYAEDIIEFSSYTKGKGILGKYNVTI